MSNQEFAEELEQDFNALAPVSDAVGSALHCIAMGRTVQDSEFAREALYDFLVWYRDEGEVAHRLRAAVVLALTGQPHRARVQEIEAAIVKAAEYLRAEGLLD